jgi:hypothetical protein
MACDLSSRLAVCLATLLLCAAPSVFASLPKLMLDEVIANAEQHDGKAVRVVGYLSVSAEGAFLYVRRYDSEVKTQGNVVQLTFANGLTQRQRELSDSYVLVEGTFRTKTKTDRPSPFSGAITGIKDISPSVYKPRPIPRLLNPPTLPS